MNIVCFTGSRADFYLQLPLFLALINDNDLSLSLIVGGNILAEQDLKTLSDIESYGLPVVHKFQTSSCTSISKEKHASEFSETIASVTPVLSSINADCAIVYADRYESFAFAITAFFSDLPLLHIEAGDITLGGTYDDNVRHAISRISHLFATSNLASRDNLIAMGEEPWRVLNVGLLSYEMMDKLPLSISTKVSDDLSLRTNKPLVILTQHSIPSDLIKTQEESDEIFTAFANVSRKYDFDLIVTAPNNDLGRDIIIQNIHALLSQKIPSIQYIESLGGLRFQALLSLASYKSVVLAGNSSSIIKEAPYFGVHGLNIGQRQTGRTKADSQLDVPANRKIIETSLADLLEKQCERVHNPYFADEPSSAVIRYIKYVFNSRQRNEIMQKKYNFSMIPFPSID